MAKTQLGYRFRNTKVFEQALTHKSADAKTNNERLEFLGDAILGAIAAAWLCEKNPQWDEGELTKERARRVRGVALAKIAQRLELEEKLRHKAPAASVEKLLEQALEAVVGAMFLEAGFEKTGEVVRGWLENFDENAAAFNPKGELQELLQPKVSTEAIEYRLVEESGPDHKKYFAVELFIEGKSFAKAKGSTKKAAQEAAAAVAVAKIKASR